MPDPHPSVTLDIAIETPAWQTLLPDAEALVERAARAALDAAVWPDVALGADTCAISLVLADNATVHTLNRDYRGKDAPTNVLSFALLDDMEADDVPPAGSGIPLMLGDIILALETVVDETTRQNKPVAHHLIHLVMHGTLHLLGYDHQTDEDAAEMESLETTLLQAFDIPNPYADNETPLTDND